mmetsp:Transcript_4219/g.12135  ORF Transcript_4219/g.12135 Transcript_4219/m.12135 type:complete len:104 (-) Transcript_4219:108-419(-)|eukprot:323298-Chlamydomonas_euryale.AAC.3
MGTSFPKQRSCAARHAMLAVFVAAGFVPAGFVPTAFVSAGFVPTGFVPAGFAPPGIVSTNFVSTGFVPTGEDVINAHASPQLRAANGSGRRCERDSGGGTGAV